MIPENAPKQITKRSIIRGTPIVAGFAVGRVVYYRDIFTREVEIWKLKENEIKSELRRLQNALDQAHSDLSDTKKKVACDMDAEHAEIFGVHQSILKDSGLLQEIEKGLKKRLLNVEKIVEDVFHRWERKIRGAPGNIMPERANDVADVGRRLLRALVGVSENTLSKLPGQSVIFAPRLLPSDTVSLDKKNTIAIITTEGQANSHSAILARALDIPFISKVKMDLSLAPPRTTVIIDGEKGWIIVNPNYSELRSYPKRIDKRIKQRISTIERIKNIALTFEGKPIRVLANVSSLSELKMAVQYRSDGIGLYRTEPLYMEKSNLPSEQELFAHLNQILNDVRNLEITLRLLDIGGDKTLPFLDVADLKDPALGLNGIRLLLKFPPLLEMQLLVFLRLSHKFKIKVLVPMVTLPQDLMEVRHYLAQAKEKLRNEGIPFDENLPFGAMIETPAALMTFDEILEQSDFVSFGTNDLVQYVMAASREKIEVGKYYEAGNRLILPLIGEAVAKANQMGKECSICGELAGNLKFTQDLLAIGLKNFSVQPSLIPAVKNKLLSLLNSTQIT